MTHSNVLHQLKLKQCKSKAKLNLKSGQSYSLPTESQIVPQTT